MTSIRKAQKQDLPDLTKMWHEFMEYHRNLRSWRYQLSDKAQPSIENRFTTYIEDPEALVLITVQNSDSSPEAAGFAVARMEDRSPVFESGNHARITDFYLRESFRNQGIGPRMYERIHSWSQDQGAERIITSIDTNNKPGVNFWEKLGMETATKTFFTPLNSDSE